MPIKVGEVEALFRYPAQSMSGELLDAADLGWHGLDGDRRWPSVGLTKVRRVEGKRLYPIRAENA